MKIQIFLYSAFQSDGWFISRSLIYFSFAKNVSERLAYISSFIPFYLADHAFTIVVVVVVIENLSNFALCFICARRNDFVLQESQTVEAEKSKKKKEEIVTLFLWY